MYIGKLKTRKNLFCVLYFFFYSVIYKTLYQPHHFRPPQKKKTTQQLNRNYCVFILFFLQNVGFFLTPKTLLRKTLFYYQSE